MTRKDKYRYLMKLHYHALEHKELWVEDKSNDLNKCDLYSPSKNRLFAYELDGTNTIIYLDEETFKEYWRQDDAMYKSIERFNKRTLSIDYLYEEFDYEFSDQVEISFKEEEYNLLITLFLETLDNEVDKKITLLLTKDYKTREIADKCNLSQTAILKRIKKIREKLKKFLF